MKKALLNLFALAVLCSLSAFAQDTMNHDDMKQDQMKHDDMKQDSGMHANGEKWSKKAVHLAGTVGEDGTTFVNDKDQKSWKVSNPEVFKGHEGHHVRVRAHVDADKDEIHVASVKMMAAHKKGKKSAMKADEMK